MTVILPRRGTAAEWVTANPVLQNGERGYETDTGKWKTGNGSTAWNTLAYEASDIAAAIHAASSKATPVDADELGLVDSAASNGLKRLTWANLKATVKTYLDGTGVAKLSTARAVQTNLASSSSASFDGSANISPGVTGTLPVGNGGTGTTTLPQLKSDLGTAADDTATLTTATGRAVAFAIAL